VREHKHCRVPARYKTSDGFRLGQWVSVRRLSQDKLSSERKERLDSLGFEWDPFTADWEDGFEHLQAFIKEHKHCRVPAEYKSSDGYRLGRWITLKLRYRKSILSPKQIERLDELGFEWEEGLKHLEAYVKEYGSCRVPPRYKAPDGHRLGGWVIEQRHKPDTLFPERRARLDALGFDWDPYATDWEEGFEHLVPYVKEYKNCRVPHGYGSPDGYRLGGWLLKQRQKREALSHERKARLDALGFDWDPHTTKWEQGFEHLMAYVNEYRHCRVPYGYKSPDGYKLGNWASVQRSLKDKMDPDRRQRLEALPGWVWKVEKPRDLGQPSGGSVIALETAAQALAEGAGHKEQQ
jgi:Helicase associated domain